jgi:histone deacetylase 11
MRARVCCILLFCVAFAARADEKPRSCEKIPIVYSRRYNIKLYGIQKLHPFDSEKYGRIFRRLRRARGVTTRCVHEPAPVSNEQLRLVHSEKYLASLKSSRVVAQVTELYALRFLPPFVVRRRIVRPMRYATGGTLLAAELANEHGWAINLSGGYHHAKASSGEGFCAFSDIALAVRGVLERDDRGHALIIDLDAHQGNGYASIFADEERVSILDAYNGLIYPKDIEAAGRIDYALLLELTDTDSMYLHKVDSLLQYALLDAKPTFVFYNAGSDIYNRDRLGGVSI